MNICMRVLATLSLVLLSGHAAAIPTLKRVTPTFFQSSISTLSAGLIVEASTDLLVLVIAGGFTISCSTSSVQHTAERVATFSDFFGPEAALRIPAVVPSSYGIPGWSSIPTGTCGGHCIMRYKGEVRDETSLSIRIGTAGLGANVGLIPAGTQADGNSILVNICRPGRPQCCTPGCVIP
jgi:hypothetical protein